MPRRSLKGVGTHLHRCNNSSPRYTRENHHAILVRFLEFPTFSNYRICITLLIIPECHGLVETIPSANITNKSKPPP